jgi:hypothetical protein
VVNIHAIGGMAGIGKTALAVHTAYRLAGCSRRQIFLPLHGTRPGGARLTRPTRWPACC